MKGIDTKRMLAIWDALLMAERSSDNELAQRAGISQSTVSSWRSEEPPQSVRLSTLGQIERSLGYKIELDKNDKWSIRKLYKMPSEGGDPKLMERQISFSQPGHFKSEDERKAYDELAEKLAQIPPGKENAERVIQMLDLLFGKKRTDA